MLEEVESSIRRNWASQNAIEVAQNSFTWLDGCRFHIDFVARGSDAYRRLLEVSPGVSTEQVLEAYEWRSYSEVVDGRDIVK